LPTNSLGKYATSKPFLTTGDSDNSCPGKVSRSFNSTDNSATTTTNNNDDNTSGSSVNNRSDEVRIIAIAVGSAVGAILLLGLLFLLFRRRNRYDHGRGGVKFLEEDRRRSSTSSLPNPYSPSGQTAFLQHPPSSTPYSSDFSYTTPSMGQRTSFYTNTYMPLPLPSPGTTGTMSPRINAYNDVLQHPTNTARNSVASRGVESEATGPSTNLAHQKTFEERQEKNVSRSMDNDWQVDHHTSAWDVIELPPTYVGVANMATYSGSTRPGPL
jgi:hypothetical protein